MKAVLNSDFKGMRNRIVDANGVLIIVIYTYSKKVGK